MTYSLTEILSKLGAPEVEETEHVRWYYFKKENTEIGDFAEIRLEDDGRRLVAELRHWKENEENDGILSDRICESVHLHAERQNRHGRFRVAKIAFDGAEYAHPEKNIIELGVSIFHARALDISLRMMEQAFQKQAEENRKPLAPARQRPPQAREWGVVVPFPGVRVAV